MSTLQLRTHAPERPNGARISALSGAMFLNALALGLLLLPITVPHVERVFPPKPDDWVIPETIAEIPSPPEQHAIEPLPQPPTTIDPPDDPPIVVENPTSPFVEYVEPVPTTIDASTLPAASGPVDVESLAYAVAPAPPYPVGEIRKRHEGTVLLQVLVDEQGHPLEVDVARSSGYPKLDDVARRQVLTKWRFRPQMQGGWPVKARARVPIQFRLDRG